MGYCRMTAQSPKVNGPSVSLYGYSLALRVHMAQATKQRLDEVKLTLQRLQRIALEAGDGEELAMKAEPMPSTEPVLKIWPAVEAAPPAPPVIEEPQRPAGRANKRYLALGMAGLAALAVMAGVTAWKASDVHRDNPPTAATAVDMPVRPPSLLAPPLPMSPVSRPQPQQGQEIAEAQGLLDIGSVTQARVVLKDLTSDSPEAALMMARSYDPNYLKQLHEHDAEPDIVEAEYWYRAWHALAWKNGLMMEADRLERIIQAMK